MHHNDIEFIYIPKEKITVDSKLAELYNAYNSENIFPQEISNRLKNANSNLILIKYANEIVGFSLFSKIYLPVSSKPILEFSNYLGNISSSKIEILNRLIDYIKEINIENNKLQIHTTVQKGQAKQYEDIGFIKYNIDGKYVLL